LCPLPLALSRETAEKSLALYLLFRYLYTSKTPLPPEPSLYQAEQFQLSHCFLTEDILQYPVFLEIMLRKVESSFQEEVIT